MTQPLVLLTVEQACTYTGRSPSTLRTWRQRYTLTRYGSARFTLFDMDELAAVLAQFDEGGDTSTR